MKNSAKAVPWVDWKREEEIENEKQDIFGGPTRDMMCSP